MEYEIFDEKQFIVDTTRQIFKWLEHVKREKVSDEDLAYDGVKQFYEFLTRDQYVDLEGLHEHYNKALEKNAEERKLIERLYAEDVEELQRNFVDSEYILPTYAL